MKKTMKAPMSLKLAAGIIPIVRLPNGEDYTDLKHSNLLDEIKKEFDDVEFLSWLYNKSYSVIDGLERMYDENNIDTLSQPSELLDLVVWLLCLPVSYPNQIATAYDLAYLNPSSPERQFHRLPPIDRMVIGSYCGVITTSVLSYILKNPQHPIRDLLGLYRTKFVHSIEPTEKLKHKQQQVKN